MSGYRVMYVMKKKEDEINDESQNIQNIQNNEQQEQLNRDRKQQPKQRDDRQMQDHRRSDKRGYNNRQVQGRGKDGDNDYYQQIDRGGYQLKQSKRVWPSQKQSSHQTSKEIYILNFMQAYRQINDSSNQRYDSDTMLSAFVVQERVVRELEKHAKDYPMFFVSQPQYPVLSLAVTNDKHQLQRCSNTAAELQQQKQHQRQRRYSDDSDPEWMSEPAKPEDTEAFAVTLAFSDIEQDLNIKRQQYQKQHGTFEKKQREREEKELNREEREKHEKEVHAQSTELLMIALKQDKKPIINPDVMQLFTQDFQLPAEDAQGHQQSLTVEEVEQMQKETSQRTESQSDDQAFDLMEFLSSGQTEEIWKAPVEQTPSRLIPFENIQVKPFSTHVSLNNRKPSDPLWFYIDQSGKVQGPFTSIDMDQWCQGGYLPPTLMISWLQPGLWIKLEKFIINLEFVSRRQLNPLKAMEPQQVESLQQQQLLSMLGYLQPIQQDNIQQKQMKYQKSQQQQQQFAPNINILNNVIHINSAQQQQQQIQSLLIQQQQQMQRNMNIFPNNYQQQNLYRQNMQQIQQMQQMQQMQSDQQKKPVKKEDEKQVMQQLGSMFNIGTKKQMQPQTMQEQSGVQLDQSDFPKLGETRNKRRYEKYQKQ